MINLTESISLEDISIEFRTDIIVNFILNVTGMYRVPWYLKISIYYCDGISIINHYGYLPFHSDPGAPFDIWREQSHQGQVQFIGWQTKYTMSSRQDISIIDQRSSAEKCTIIKECGLPREFTVVGHWPTDDPFICIQKSTFYGRRCSHNCRTDALLLIEFIQLLQAEHPWNNLSVSNLCKWFISVPSDAYKYLYMCILVYSAQCRKILNRRTFAVTATIIINPKQCIRIEIEMAIAE